MNTATLAQYQALKEQYPNAILLIQLGSAYEAYGDDAQTIADTCGIELEGTGELPIVAIWRHSSHKYIEQLTKAGHVVAVADVVTDRNLVPSGIESIIQRRELTPEPNGDYMWA